MLRKWPNDDDQGRRQEFFQGRAPQPFFNFQGGGGSTLRKWPNGDDLKSVRCCRRHSVTVMSNLNNHFVCDSLFSWFVLHVDLFCLKLLNLCKKAFWHDWMKWFLAVYIDWLSSICFWAYAKSRIMTQSLHSLKCGATNWPGFMTYAAASWENMSKYLSPRPGYMFTVICGAPTVWALDLRFRRAAFPCKQTAVLSL